MFTSRRFLLETVRRSCRRSTLNRSSDAIIATNPVVIASISSCDFSSRHFGTWNRTTRKEASAWADQEEDEEESNTYSYFSDGEEDPEAYQYLEDEEYNQQYSIYKEEQTAKTKQVKKELEGRKGRLFEDPLEISDEFFASNITFDDLPDWTPEVVSRLARNKVKVYPEGIPTLDTLSQMVTPSPPPPHPSKNRKAYAKYSLRTMKAAIQHSIPAIANPRLAHILTMENPTEQQEAIDELYEYIEHVVSKEHSILAAHPQFPQWTETATRQHLVYVKKHLTQSEAENSSSSSSSSDSDSDSDSDAETDESNQETSKDTDVISETVDFLTSSTDETTSTTPTSKKTEKTDASPFTLPGLQPTKQIEPMFIDLAHHVEEEPPSTDSNKIRPPPPTAEQLLEKIFPVTGIHGNLKEEWELSAHPTTRRIMVRSCITDMANILQKIEQGQEPTKNYVFVTGNAGVGKTAALTSIVASARKSGYVVLYLADGARLAEHGKFIEPSPHRENVYDIPYLSQEFCSQLFTAHGDLIEQVGLKVSPETLKHFFTEAQLSKQIGQAEGEEEGDISLKELLRKGSEHQTISAPVYSCAVEVLMNQTEVPFLAVLDEYNVYHLPNGHYFHMEYDLHVNKSIPYDQINVFAPFMKSFASSSIDTSSPGPKRGAVVASISSTRPVSKEVTDQLVENMKQQPHVEMMEVSSFSKIEVDHVLANYECIGVGKLRFDEGKTISDEQEVAFLRMQSGCVGKKLLDGIIF